jgi:hypothetical protein
MKPFIRITAILLATVFLIATAFAWVELLQQGNLLSNALVKPASAWLVTGLMFLALALRGWRGHKPPGNDGTQTMAR